MKGGSCGGIASFVSSFLLYTSPFFLGYWGTTALYAEEFSQLSHYAAQMYPRGTVVVDTRVGDLIVEGWDEGRVEVEAEKLVQAASEAKARRLYEQLKIELKENDEEFRLRVISPPRRPWRLFRGATKLSVNLRIRMPIQASLIVRCVDGDLRVRRVEGRQEVRVSRGDVEINVPSLSHLRSLDARTWLGYVESDLPGRDSAGFARRVTFWNPSGEQDITVRVRLGGVYVYGNSGQ
jgi:hypothetical protein